MKKFLLLFFSITFLTINYISASIFTIDEEYLTITPGNVGDLEVNVYPNPLIGNQLNIESNYEFNGIEILDIVGKSIMSETYDESVSKRTIRLDSFEKGLYLIRIKFDNKNVYTQKIIIK